MQCQLCKQQTATIHLTEITNGLRTETHLCELCAQKQGIAVKNQIPLNELLTTLLSVQEKEKEGVTEQDHTGWQKTCPACGMTMQTFSKNSLLGCADDYQVFRPQLTAVIERAQGGRLTHCGKVPRQAPAETKDRVEMLNLRRMLDEAVRNEDYETAAKLRDSIRKLK